MIQIKNFINSGNPRSVKIKKNILASFIIKGISIVLNLLLIPIAINYINPTQYGIWLTLSSIITMFYFFDIGLGNGLKNKLSEALAMGNFELAQKYISTSYAILSSFGILIWLLFSLFNNFINWSLILNVSTDMQNQLSYIVLILFTFFCFQFVLKLISTILTSNQEPSRASFFDMLGLFFAFIFVFILTKTTHGSLLYLVLAMGAAQLIALLIANVWYFSCRYHKFRPSLKHVDFSCTKSLMGLGIKYFIIQLSAVFIFQVTNIIIVQLFGAKDVTVFNIAYRYFFSLTMISGIVSAPFWAAFTEAYTNSDFKWMKNVVKKINYLWIILSIIAVFFFFFCNWVYRIWIGDSVVIPLSVSFFMALNVIITIRFNFFIMIINGLGKINLETYLNIFLSLLYIPLAILLGKTIGINGLIIANITMSSIFAIIAPLQVSKIINQDATGIWNK